MALEDAPVVFFQGAFASAQQVHRLTTHPDPLFLPHEIRSIAADLPEVVYSSPLFLRIAFTWILNLCLLAMGRPVIVQGAPYYIDFRHVNLGQHSDIEQCRARGVGDIAFGISRGAATTFARWALAEEEELASGTVPKLLLLEGCPASIPHVLEFRNGARLASLAEWLLEQMTAYKAADARLLSPLALAHRFPHNIPVAFVTAKHDTSVSPNDTYALVDALQRAGHPSVHVLELQDAHHNNYYTGSERDRLAYKAFVMALREDTNPRASSSFFH